VTAHQVRTSDGEVSMIPVEAMRRTAGLIPRARLEIFGAGEGGSHFMFWENPAQFNHLIRDFAGPKGSS
jgi:non-heme chloroperoxidase